MQWNMRSIQRDPRFQEKFGVTQEEKKDVEDKLWSFKWK